jgi:L-threonylcarbamoyladenylate synthase
MPKHEVAQRPSAARVPIAAPSANRFGRLSPTTAAHVLEQLGDDLPPHRRRRPAPIGIESTVVSFLEGEPDLAARRDPVGRRSNRSPVP